MVFLDYQFLDEFKRLSKRQMLYQFLNFSSIVSTALMIWKFLICMTGSVSPIVVVLSGSMEPAFHRGDILFLTHDRAKPVEAGDICVFKIKEREIPIVHRAIKTHQSTNETYKYLTKGDNNMVDDRGLYSKGQLWLEKKDGMGKIRGQLPYVGMLTIWLTDYPQIKWPLLAIMGLFVILHRD